jgi:MYXO-CTERM domain-containing protein
LLAALISIPPRLLARAKPGQEISGLPPRMLDWLGESLAAWIAPVSVATPNWPVAIASLGLLALGGVLAWRRRNTLLLCLVSIGVLAQAVTAFTIGHKANWTMAERYVSHGLVPFLVVGAWLLVSREIAVFARIRLLLGAVWLLASAACLPLLFTRVTHHDLEEPVLIAAHEMVEAMNLAPTGVVLESYRAVAHFRLVAPNPLPVWLRQGKGLRLVEYTKGLAGPPAVPRLVRVPVPAGTYLLVGRLGQPEVDCPSLAAWLGREGRARRAAVGVLCVLEEPRSQAGSPGP